MESFGKITILKTDNMSIHYGMPFVVNFSMPELFWNHPQPFSGSIRFQSRGCFVHLHRLKNHPWPLLIVKIYKHQCQCLIRFQGDTLIYPWAKPEKNNLGRGKTAWNPPLISWNPHMLEWTKTHILIARSALRQDVLGVAQMEEFSPLCYGSWTSWYDTWRTKRSSCKHLRRI